MSYLSGMDFIRKARGAGLTPGNAVSWLSLEAMRICGAAFGTARLYVKARLLGVEIGRGVRAHGPVGLLRWPGGKIKIGDNVSIISSWRRATASALPFPTRLRVFGKGAAIEIGAGSQLSGASITARSRLIHIGRHALFAPGCIVVDSDFHAPWPPEARAFEPGLDRDAPVEIGDYAWLGMGSIILKGAAIGAGAIIGAGSVVTGHVPPNTLAAGCPARIIRELGPEETHAS